MVTVVSRVLLTGMSGAGKTTVLAELGLRGRLVVDTDYGDWVAPDGTWDEGRMDALLARHPHIVVAGTVSNQGRFYDRFQHVVLLSAPIDVLLDRVRNRTNNPYGKTPEQQAAIKQYLVTVEPLLRVSATLELDGRLTPSQLADTIEALIACP
jgi:shikimate kinase